MSDSHADDWAIDATFDRIKRRRRTGVLPANRDRWPNSPRLLFVYLRPDGRLDAVIDAEDMDSAWVIATGWGDKDDILDRQAQGYAMRPCMVEWEDD